MLDGWSLRAKGFRGPASKLRGGKYGRPRRRAGLPPLQPADPRRQRRRALAYPRPLVSAPEPAHRTRVSEEPKCTAAHNLIPRGPGQNFVWPRVMTQYTNAPAGAPNRHPTFLIWIAAGVTGGVVDRILCAGNPPRSRACARPVTLSTLRAARAGPKGPSSASRSETGQAQPVGGSPNRADSSPPPTTTLTARPHLRPYALTALVFGRHHPTPPPRLRTPPPLAQPG